VIAAIPLAKIEPSQGWPNSYKFSLFFASGAGPARKEYRQGLPRRPAFIGAFETAGRLAQERHRTDNEGQSRKVEPIAAQALKDSELRYRRLFEAAQDGILILDARTGMIEDVNPYLMKMLGYSREEFVQKKLWEVGAFKDVEASQEAFETLQVNEYIRYEDLPLKTKDGRLIQVEFVSNVYEVGREKVIQCNIRDITQNKRAEKRVQRQLEHLTALSAIDRVIAGNFDLKLSLSEILMHVKAELGVDAADILLFDASMKTLEYGAESGFHTKSVRKTHVRLNESYAGRAVIERRLVQIPNLREEPDSFFSKILLAGENFVCYYGMPLIAKGQIKGVLEVFHRAALEPDAEWLDFLSALAGQTAIAIENAMLFESLQRSNTELSMAYDATIEGWSRALDLRDKETEGHTQRVTEMTIHLARGFGFGETELVQVRWGALLHDIGKMGVPDGILLKPGPLTDQEWVVMKKHPLFAYEMLSPIHYLKQALDIPLCHHERWDGSGYPHGLTGERIPIVARIFAVVDVWDALNSDRPYRAAWAAGKVREHIRAASGTHFDPQVVELFMQLPSLPLESR
jgi:PAS domain S-box-containing protein